MRIIDSDYIDDLKYIQKAMLLGGYECSLYECQEFWERVSDDSDASWLILPDGFDDTRDIIIEHNLEIFS